METVVDGVWVFMGLGARHPSAVFSMQDKAEEWIKDRRLSGTLTWYPLDVPVLDWVVDQGRFDAPQEAVEDPAFVQGFSSASQPHHHYESGA